ncbi:MAG: glycosyl hydrolase, partial [Solirubrobacteraceae bacterium]
MRGLKFAAVMVILGSACVPGTAGASALVRGFANPPAPAHPGVWATGTSFARPAATVGALAQAGFGTAQLDIDVSNPSVARSSLAAALATARHDGIRLDPNVTGHQAFASPAVTTATSMQELVPAAVSVTGPATTAAAPPYPSGLTGSPTLVAVTAARVVRTSGQTTLLDPSSAVDLTPDVVSGVVHWTVPAGRWELFGFWRRATGQTVERNPFESPSVWSSRVPTTSPGQYFLADIFSGTGVSQALSSAASDLFGTANLSALKGERATLFHDSLELQAEMFWTGDFPRQFSERRGYSVIRYLPALWNVAESSFDPLDPTQGGPIPRPAFDFTGGVGARVRYDYARTLTDLYVDRYLKTLTARAHALGLKTRVQVAYNYLGLNVTRAAEAVDIPETETFDLGWPKPFVNTLPQYGTPRWRYRIDAIRETAAGAHIAHHDRVTLEWGDDFAIYRKQPLQYANEVNQAVSGGVTQPYLAGFIGPATQRWPTPPPGTAAIGLGENWSTNWPQWRDWRPLDTYLARTTEVVEQGSPRMDVAIYNDNGLSSPHDSSPIWANPKLSARGYSYEFVDPVSLTMREAGAVTGRLFGNGPDYRALVVNNQSTIPADTAQAILRMA